MRNVWIAALVAALIGCAQPQAPERHREGGAPVAEGNVRIGAFNMENFGPTKAGNAAIVNGFANIALEYDALVLQEIEDVSGDAPNVLLAEVNRLADRPYNLALSPRLGRTSAKEQYGLLYRPDRVELLDARLIDDPEDEFEREPFVFTIRHRTYTYGLIALHAKPDAAVSEVNQAAFAYDAFRNATGIDSAFVIGDLNADCSYASDEELRATQLCADTRFSWLIPDGADTTTGSTDCAYDRIVVRGPIAQSIDVPAVYHFDQHLRLSAASYSDHYPVEIEVGDAGGDYSGFTCAPAEGAAESPFASRIDGRYAYEPPEAGGSGGGSSCCRVCSTGQACGDSCISRESTCHVGQGCACNGG